MSYITPFSSLLRPSLHASTSRLLLPFIPTPSHQPFSTTPPTLVSRDRRMRAKIKRDRHIKAVDARSEQASSDQINFIFGYLPVAGEKTPWDGCRLQRVLLRPEAIYSAPPVDYAAGKSPEHYLPGLAPEDQSLLFGALPYTSTSLKARRTLAANKSLAEDAHAALTAAEEGKVEQMQRVLDLRNASKRGIEVVNRQRVIEEFGGVREGKGENTGSSEVQAALLTQKIRSLHDHLLSNRRDFHNMRALRVLVHQRQQILKYFSRKQPEKYDQLLTDLGLERRGVEGEIRINRSCKFRFHPPSHPISMMLLQT